MKKIFHDSGFEDLLHKYQDFSIICLGISILAYFLILDFTHKSSKFLLGLMSGFAIVVFGIGLIWLVKDIRNFSKTYKAVYEEKENLKKLKKDRKFNVKKSKIKKLKIKK